jgi:hypothetical protein
LIDPVGDSRSLQIQDAAEQYLRQVVWLLRARRQRPRRRAGKSVIETSPQGERGLRHPLRVHLDEIKGSARQLDVLVLGDVTDFGGDCL